MSWLLFALLTVAAWGVYGVFIHNGSLGMADKVNGRYKAFLFVGFAYFLVAVIAPLIMLRLSGKAGATNFLSYPTAGWAWSLVAGVVGAIGAFGVLLALGASPNPAAYGTVIMSIIFCGAPIVNAFVSMAMHPPEGGMAGVKWQFWAGIVIAAVGGCMVALYKPDAPAKPHGAPVAAPAVQEPAKS